MRFIGDVHGKFDQYRSVTDGATASIQVGDFGVGFASVPVMPNNHRFIRGNHDNPGQVSHYQNYIPDGHYENGMFFLGGGESIDRVERTEGLDWWADEQLSSSQLCDMVDRYLELRPSILVCHECPSVAVERLFGQHVRGKFPSRTSQALGSMIELCPPGIVIFGHFHDRRDRVINGIRFICVETLGHIDLDI